MLVSSRGQWVSAALILLACEVSPLYPQPNLLPNPSFESTEPPPPNAASAKEGGVVPADLWLPRTWNVYPQDGADYRSPDDPAQAHSGRRCVYCNAARGYGIVRYGPMPIPKSDPWKFSFWARGKGQLVVGFYQVLPDRWNRMQKEWPFTLEEQWKQFDLEVQPPNDYRQWILDLTTRGTTQVWIDDASVTYPGLTALALPPDKPVMKDEHTLLYLAFEEPLNEDAYFIKGQVHPSKDNQGRFGKSLIFGPEGYIACSANESLDPQEGTIEVWAKFNFPGNDGMYHNLVSVPGPEGMTLCKDQYSHVHFGFSSGWATLSNATAMGYAHYWQPGVWRHVAACWDKDLMQVFVDGKLIAWKDKPKLSRALGPELGIGSAGMEIDDLRISNIVRFRQSVPTP
ncbi:MAG: hypothetical protein HY318_04640 [Armatimonadetes bacterium]|nr:hypothetical protein [Armatimonadota bacterium]